MSQPIKVLFVEDAEDDVTLVTHVLRHAGYEVAGRRVAKATALTTALRAECWDLILSDFSMPGFSGFDALRLAREMAGDVPFIVVSGAIGEEIAASLMRAGANDFIAKANLARLVPAIDRELKEAADRRARREAEAAHEATKAREAAALAQIEAAHEADRLKSLFLHSVSHELRNPLTSVIGYLELVQEQAAARLTPEERSYVERALGGTVRLQRLIDDLLDYARIEGGIFNVAPTPTDLTALVREVMADMRPQADDAGVAIALEAPDDEITGEIDARRIGQVLGNLLGNAIKFSPRGGTVRLRVKAGAERIVLEVADEGPGIPEADMPRLFRLFSQLDDGRLRGGTGLGLAIAKSLVTAHGGVIGVRAGDHGRGATFFVDLPRRLPAPPRVTIDIGDRAPGRVQ